MAGAIIFDEDRGWSVNSWVFYWTIDRLAELVTDPTLAEQLRTVSENHLGAISWRDVTSAQFDELLRAVAELPEVGAARLPAGEHRESVLAALAELADLAGGRPGT